jgi:hypothetical protein
MGMFDSFRADHSTGALRRKPESRRSGGGIPKSNLESASQS